MTPGTRLGPYRIVRALGAGGMGEVYLAEDSRLGRQVAIKVLPPQFATDPERLARFEQEARAAAALNHPNIAVVHDVGHETDNDGNTTHFLVQEFLDGQDLHSLLQAGPLPRKRALLLGAEIAEALSAAHAAGIVHRDLKPANVFVSPAGHAKVLDFGLAKLVEPPAAPGAASGDAAESPTMLGTMAGAVLGSAGYMAPEQAAGGAVDHRADLFACGCVLYEMLVGQRAFEGDTLIDTLHAITRTEPEALTVEDSPLDGDLRWLLQKCLAKEPASRCQSAGDLAVDLRRLESTPGPSGAASRTAAAATKGTNWLPWVAAPVALALGLAVGAVIFPGPGSEAKGLRISIAADLPPDFVPSYFAISPDGSTIAFRDGSTESALVVRRLDSFERVPVLNSGGALGPTFSPDGNQLSFFASGRLWVVDVAGGTPRAVCNVGQINSSSFWSDDGFIYFVQWATGTGLWRVPATGGTAEEILPLSSTGVSQSRPRPLPDGRGISVDDGVRDSTVTVVHFYDGSPPIRIDRKQVTYLNDGRALFVDAGTLSIAQYDPETYAIIGRPTALEVGVAQYELSAAGTLLFRFADTDILNVQSRIARYSRTGRIESIGPAGAPSERLQISPDGRSIATTGRDLGGLHIWDVSRGTVRRATEDGLYPQWGPDNNTVYLQRRDGNEYSLDRVTLDGSAPREQLLTSINSIWPTDVSDDGGRLLYYEIHPDTERDLWVLPLDGSQQPFPFLITPSSERSAVFSPDDRWVAYMSDISGREEVYVRPADNPAGGEVLVTVRGGREPRWSPDGSEIYFRLDDGLWAVPVSTEPRFNAGEPQLLFSGPFVFEEGGRNQQYDVLPDGGFIMVEVPEYFEELRVAVDWLNDVTDQR